jgi:hypothetical protein
MRRMTSNTSVQVEELTSGLPNAALWGSFKVKNVEGGRLELMGWALGTATDVERIEIVAGDDVVASTSPGLPRAEVAKEFPERQLAANCGFEVVIEARGKGRSRLGLRAVLEDGSEVPMGELRVVAPGRAWSGVFRRS